MATITTRTGKRGKTYKVNYRDPAGLSQTRTFKRAVDARAFANTVEADKLRGAYVAPKKPRTLFADRAADYGDNHRPRRLRHRPAGIAARIPHSPRLQKASARRHHQGRGAEVGQ